jgi:hypothetical protein
VEEGDGLGSRTGFGGVMVNNNLRRPTWNDWKWWRYIREAYADHLVTGRFFVRLGI